MNIDEELAWGICKTIQQNALIPPTSSKKVGACVLGHKDGKEKFFSGCNIVISTSHVYHAEVVALLACLAENYKPLKVFVTSSTFNENVHCCLDCRARLLESNINIKYVIFNPDGTIKAHGNMADDCQYIMEDKSGKINWSNIK